MKRITLFFGTMLLIAVNVFAQIQGDVVDQKDKGVPNAIIIATDSFTKVADTVKSDKRGFYAFKGLKPGKYKIQVKAAGFQPAIFEKIEVNEGDTGEIEQIDIYRGQRLDITISSAKASK